MLILLIYLKENLTLIIVDQVLDFEAEVVPEEIVAPMLLNLCVRLRSLQASNSFVVLLYLLPLLLHVPSTSKRNLSYRYCLCSGVRTTCPSCVVGTFKSLTLKSVWASMAASDCQSESFLSM